MRVTENPKLACPPDKVPGWLDENGDPQGCVDNNPTPGAEKELPAAEAPAPALEAATVQPVPHPSELAVTGTVDPIAAGALALGLVISGAVLMLRRSPKGACDE